jgi:EpsI family protein
MEEPGKGGDRMTRGSRFLIVSALLLACLGARAYVSIKPQAPKHEKLAALPKDISGYKVEAEAEITDDVQAVLRADDYVLRRYESPNGKTLDLFIAYYEYQRAGESMHSPKNCLPGAGWSPILNDYLTIGQTADGKPAVANRYVIEKDGRRQVVIYWYQANGRVIANEYWGKLYLVTDALRTGRRDGAILRVIATVDKNETVDSATKRAVDFTRALLPLTKQVLPV